MKLKLSTNHGIDSKAWQVLKPLQQYSHINGVDTVWGLGSGNWNIVMDAIKNNKTWMFTDMPYWNRFDPNYPQAEYNWRICLNSIHCNTVMELPNDRSKTIDLKEWRDAIGEYILVAPSSQTIHNFIGKPNWTQDTVDKLKTITDLPIKVRQKPRKNGTSGPHVAEVPLHIDLANAMYVVTSCSVVGVESVIEGIPTFCEPEAACAPVSNTDIFSLKPKICDRQLWLNTLSYHQYTPNELQNGTFVSIFKNLYPGVFE